MTMAEEKPNIGMPVWQFDVNRRVYKKNAEGRSVGGPIWREHWVQLEIVSETSRSWLVGRPNWLTKTLGKYAKRGWPHGLATSQESIDRMAFVEGRYRIAERVGRCQDHDTLKAVEAALDAFDTTKGARNG
jgi:hypothetical protein